MPQDMIAVFLNPLPIVIAVMFGSTMRDDMSNTPTNFIDAMTVMLATTMKKIIYVLYAQATDCCLFFIKGDIY